MNKLTLIAFSFSLPFLSACSPSMPSMPELPDMPDILPDLSLPTLYKDDIQQGSVLERFKINQLKTGMSKTQVKDLIGSPSIIDPFHSNQWDYINHSTLHEKDDIHYRLVLKFTGEKLSLINTSGIKNLSALTDKEKALEDQRIAEEKAVIEAKKKALLKAKIVAEQKKIAKEKAVAEAEQQKILAEKMQAEALKKNIELEKAQSKKIKKKAEKIQPPAKQEPQQAVDEPWYKFW